MGANVKPRMRLIGLASLALVLTQLIGCGGSEPIPEPTTGRVVFDNGEPVRFGQIEYRSMDNGRRYASQLDGDGCFELLDFAGNEVIEPGEYEVIVYQFRFADFGINMEASEIPRRYADFYTSDLRATIEPGQQRRLDVVLKSDSP